MIDLIGALLSIVFLFAIAAVVSAVLALLVWVSLLRQKTRRKRYILAAILLPLASAGWLTLCAVLLPGESLFGDIDEPLPHNFRITALGKMPDAGAIEGGDLPPASVTVPVCNVSEVAVANDLVAGRCTYKYFSPPPADHPGYFVFNSANGQSTTYETEADLDKSLGRHVELTELPYFRSPLAATRRRINRAIEFTPPSVGLVVLVLAIVGEHRRAARLRANNA